MRMLRGLRAKFTGPPRQPNALVTIVSGLVTLGRKRKGGSGLPSGGSKTNSAPGASRSMACAQGSGARAVFQTLNMSPPRNIDPVSACLRSRSSYQRCHCSGTGWRGGGGTLS